MFKFSAHVIADLLFVMVKPQPVREPGAGGLVDVQQVGLGIPGIGVMDSRVAGSIHPARPILAEQSHFTRTARPTRHPQGDGVGGRRIAGFKKPVLSGCVQQVSQISSASWVPAVGGGDRAVVEI